MKKAIFEIVGNDGGKYHFKIFGYDVEVTGYREIKNIYSHEKFTWTCFRPYHFRICDENEIFQNIIPEYCENFFDVMYIYFIINIISEGKELSYVRYLRNEDMIIKLSAKSDFSRFIKRGET